MESVYFFILGAGIGLIMQILTLIVQNTADYRDLGTATSGVTFFRTLGGSFGAAVLGSIYSNQLADRLPAAIVTAQVPPSAATNPDQLHALPPQAQAPIIEAYAEALHNVFLYAVPVALLALVVALFLPQVKLRGGGGRSVGTGEGFAMPEGADADTQLENIIGQVLRKKGKSAAPDVLTASGSRLDIATAWGVMGVYLRYAITGRASEAAIEESVGIPTGVLQSYFDELAAAGYVTRDGDALRLTKVGNDEVQMIIAAWRAWLVTELEDWLPAAGSEPTTGERVDAALDRIVIRLVRENELDPAPSAS